MKELILLSELGEFQIPKIFKLNGIIIFMAQDRKEELKSAVLGKKVTKFVFDGPNAKILETFQNRYSKRDYFINIDIPEFTNICPLTGQPDFAVIRIRYIPVHTINPKLFEDMFPGRVILPI